MVRPDDFLLDQNCYYVHLQGDKGLSGHWYNMYLTESATSPLVCVFTDQLAATRPHRFCGRTSGGAMEMCRCQASNFAACWKTVHVHCIDVLALRVLRRRRMREFSIWAFLRLVVFCVFVILYVAASFWAAQNPGTSILVLTGFVVGLVRVFKEVSTENQEYLDILCGAAKRGDLLSSIACATMWLTRPVFRCFSI